MNIAVTMMRSVLLVLALTAACSGILPEIADWGINHIPEWEVRMFEGEEQPPEDPQLRPEDAALQVGSQRDPLSYFSCLAIFLETIVSLLSFCRARKFMMNGVPTITNFFFSFLVCGLCWQGCIYDEECGKERYCFYDTQKSKCRRCKDTDESCSKDVECCGDQLCMWGQCTQNATKGKAGSTCQYQTDCSPELCCAFHKALLFPVCLAKPIERERCLDSSNHLMELLSWDVQNEGPRRHCPCAGDLHCQHLGRGSMCLKGEDSSEEDLTDSLYSEIDYIL
uniref:Dickkopf WNT signaling pathway inhibitor 3a n=1 Tax=Oryzias sinensis TaxID=183150 RepID=A0A8C7Y351_9TELE